MQRHSCRLEGWTNAARSLLLKTSQVAVNCSQKTTACIFEASLMITEELFRMSRRTHLIYSAGALRGDRGSGQRDWRAIKELERCHAETWTRQCTSSGSMLRWTRRRWRFHGWN